MRAHSNDRRERNVTRLRHLRILSCALLFTAVIMAVRVPLWSYWRGGDQERMASVVSEETARSASPDLAREAGPHSRPATSAGAERRVDVAAEESEERPEELVAAEFQTEASPGIVVAPAGHSPASPPATPREAIGGWIADMREFAAESASRIVATGRGESDEAPPASSVERKGKNHAPVGSTNLQRPPAVFGDILLYNPRRNRVAVHYLVGGEPYSLYPGQWHELPAEPSVDVVFDAGADFGRQQVEVREGVFAFHVSAERGWELLAQ